MCSVNAVFRGFALSQCVPSLSLSGILLHPTPSEGANARTRAGVGNDDS
jgi:hypothetical protein